MPGTGQRDLLLHHAERIESEIAAQQTRLAYLPVKAALWDARDRGDIDAEAEASRLLPGVATRMWQCGEPGLHRGHPGGV